MQKRLDWLNDYGKHKSLGYRNEISAYLNLKPYELLMHPQDAMRLRRLQRDIVRLAHDSDAIDKSPDNGSSAKKVSTN